MCPIPFPNRRKSSSQVHYAALNPADAYLAENLYPAKPRLPHILGRDGVGTVVEVGSGVKDVRVGERRAILRGEVGINRPGTFAQRVAVPAQNLVAIPAGWTEPEAAGATLVYLTAYQALTMWGPLPPSAVVLVTGASGGVGVAAVQLAAAMGYKVVALSRSPEKSRRLEQLGAAVTFNPEDPKWSLALKSTLEPRRVDLAIDNIGGKLLPEVISTLGELGRVSLVGRLAGPVPSFNTATLFFRRNRLGGSRRPAPAPMPRATPFGRRSSSCWRAPAPARRWTRSSRSTNCPRPSSAWPRGRWGRCWWPVKPAG